jgi:hypothetical protein
MRIARISPENLKGRSNENRSIQSILVFIQMISIAFILVNNEIRNGYVELFLPVDIQSHLNFFLFRNGYITFR